MKERSSTSTRSGNLRVHRAPSRRLTTGGEANWSFVYVFFTNHTPFDAPNRSEPCPRP